MYKIQPENAKLLQTWFKDRGGVCVWNSIDLCDPGAQAFTPADKKEKPRWKYSNTPVIVTDSSEFHVITYKEVRRFHVAIRITVTGRVKCTDASSAKIRAACDKAGEGSVYQFDYDNQEAVISIPVSTIPLSDWTEV